MPHSCSLEPLKKKLTAITQECWEQYWTSPGDNTPQDTNYTATCLPSQKLYKLDEPDTQDTAGEARTNSSVMYSNGPPHMAKQKQDDQLEHTYSSYVRIRDVTLKTCQKRWMIGRSSERGSRISVLVARHDDDDDLDRRNTWNHIILYKSFVFREVQVSLSAPFIQPWATSKQKA